MELELIQNKIYEIRGYKVMLDFDLTSIYPEKTYIRLFTKSRWFLKKSNRCLSPF